MSDYEFPLHAPDRPCPVIDLLVGRFGDEVGTYLLWEFTCFPMSDRHAWEQARSLVAADRVGLLDEYLASERALQEAAMRE